MATIGGGYFNENANAFVLTKEDAVEFFEKAVLLNDALNNNPVNLYSYGTANLDGTVEMLGMEAPTDSLQGRTGQNFIDKGQIQQKRTTTAVVDFELNSSQAPTAFQNEFFEYLINPDRPYDFQESPEFRALLGQVLGLVRMGLKSDIASLFHFWNHPDIPAFDQPTYLDVNKTQPNPAVVAVQPANVDIQSWLRFHDQHTIDNSSRDFNKLGAVSKLDSLQGGFNPSGYQSSLVAIDAANYSVNIVNGVPQATYTGNVGGTGGLFEQLAQSASIELQIMVDRASTGSAPVICVSPEIFDAYLGEFDTVGSSDNIYYSAFLRATGEEPSLGLNRMVAQWRGLPVVKTYEYKTFNSKTGKPRLRAMLCAAQNLSIRSKVYGQGQVTGSNALAPDAGIIIQQEPSITKKGRVNMLMNGSIGAGFVDYNLVSYASSDILTV